MVTKIAQNESFQRYQRYATPLGIAFAAFVRELEKHTQPQDTSPDEQEVNDALAREVASVHLRRVARSQVISQKELARRLKVNPSVISRIFKSPEKSSLQTIRRIADALHVSLHDILPRG